MKENPNTIVSIKLFKPIAYLTLFGISVGGVLSITQILGRWEAMFFIVIIGFFISQYPSINIEINNIHVFWMILIQALMISFLLQFPGTGEIFAILFFILSTAAGLYFSLRFNLVFITILAAVAFFSLYRFNNINSALQLSVSLAGGYYFFGIAANTLMQLQRAQWSNQQLVSELISKNKQLEDYSSQIESLTVVQERNHLAREVHDTIGHRLTVAAVQLEGSLKLLDTQPDRAKNMLDTVYDQVRSALRDLRITVNRLREPIELELPLAVSINRMVKSFQEATGLALELSIELNETQLTPNQHITLFRTIQEALTNIQKHAQATNIRIILKQTNHYIILVIHDNGKGFENSPINYGFGIKGLMERAALINADFLIKSGQGAGTELCLTIPIIYPGER